MPSARSIITIAVVSSLTFLAIEHFKQSKPATASRVGLST
jgi:hypothetical protein